MQENAAHNSQSALHQKLKEFTGVCCWILKKQKLTVLKMDEESNKQEKKWTRNKRE